jgi:phosphoglycolate phosphatase
MISTLALITIDLDGTIVDSVTDLHEAVARMQRALSRDVVDEEAVRGWVGNGIERLVHRALTGSMSDDADDAVFTHALGVFKEAYAEVNGHYATLYPGVRDGLSWLATLNVPLVMVTNKASNFANPLLETLGISHYFAHCIGGDDVSAKKPDPAPLLLAAQLCSVAPAHSVLIGDSISDFKAARAAGFQSIGVTYGYNHGQPVRSLQQPLAPDVIIDSFAELPDRLPPLFG